MILPLDILRDERSFYDEGGEAWKVLTDAITRVEKEAVDVAKLLEMVTKGPLDKSDEATA